MHYHNHYATLDPVLFHAQNPLPLDNPTLIHLNEPLLDDISPTAKYLDWQRIIGGDNAAFDDGFYPLAMAYAGHQFGHWAGQLGDGRGLLLAQVKDKHGKLLDLHLKGAGRTPFSRMGDGRAMLDSSIREYLCAHALSSLGVPSSMALGLVASDTLIMRDGLQPAAALLRVSDCHVRLGHFEWLAAYQPDKLADFSHEMIAVYYPKLVDLPDCMGEFALAVCRRTAQMIAQWQLCGFVHGVMNTDNFNITGSTLDFGPFGMMERFDPTWVSNHSDNFGRYSYQNQPSIGAWNLQKWLMSLDGLIPRAHMATCLKAYESQFFDSYDAGLCAKLGLAHNADNLALAYRWLTLMQAAKLDYTNSHRALIALIDSSGGAHHEHMLLQTLQQDIANANKQHEWQGWQADWQAKLDDDSLNKLNNNNPVYVLRRRMAAAAIERAKAGDNSEVARLFTLLQNPYQTHSIATQADITAAAIDEMPVLGCMS